MSIVKIIWFDACTQSGWIDKNLSKDLLLIKNISVGILIKKTKKFITIAQTKNTNHFGELLTIPRCNIKKYKEL